MKKVLFITIVFFTLFCFAAHDLHAADETDEYIKGMTLEEKIGQIMLIGLPGKTLRSTDINFLKHINPGGIILYKRNLEDASDIPPLILSIKSIFQNNGLPLFFAIDQEGGIVHRIDGEYHKPPSAPAIGAINSEELAREIGLSVGNALGDLGININLAPVLDVPTDLQSSRMTRRSFSNDPHVVARLGTAYISGLHDAGILAAAKHFPGIGRTHEDSHSLLPRITWQTKDEKKADLMPFQRAVGSDVDIIMVGHFIAEPGDSKNPISLSPYWMTDVLKKTMGFDGLVIVDNIEMKPIEDIMPISEAAVQSFKAGADIIMVSHERKTQGKVFISLFQAVLKGTVSLERLNESVKKIIKVKKKMLSRETTHVSSKNLKDISHFVAENTITVLTLKNAPLYKMSMDDKVLFVGYNANLFKAIKKTFKHADTLNTTVVNYKKLHPETPIEEFIKTFDALLIDTSYTDASRIISLCNELNQKYFVLQMYFPDIQKTLEVLKTKNILILYENDGEHFKVAFEILRGLRQAKGKLPYNLPIPPSYSY